MVYSKLKIFATKDEYCDIWGIQNIALVLNVNNESLLPYFEDPMC